MDKKKLTYIGVSGVTSPDQVVSLKEKFEKFNGNNSHKLMIGVLTNSNTVRGHNNLEKRFAERAKIKNIFRHDERIFNVLHFTTRTPSLLVENLKLLWPYAGDNCHGIQLGVDFPSVESIKQIKKICFNGSKKSLILEVSPAMLKEHNPKQLVKRFKKYEDRFSSIIDYVLLDCSLGNRSIEPERIRDYVHEIKTSQFSFGLGLAGSLGPNNFSSIEDIIERYPCLSIDAERGLKDLHGNLVEEKYVSYFDLAATLYAIAAIK